MTDRTNRRDSARNLIARRHLIAGGAGAGAAALIPAAAGARAPASSHDDSDDSGDGRLTVLAEPIRLFDSRRADSLLEGDKLTQGNSVAVSASLPDDGRVLESVFINLTITETEGSGYLSVRAAEARGLPAPETSNINWTDSGVTLANFALSRIGQHNSIEIHCDGVEAATHVIVDLQGYVPFVADE